MDLKELRKLVNFCKKSGIISIKTDGIELSFASHSVAPKMRRGKDPDKPPVIEGPSDQDFLFWSSTPHGMEQAV